MEAKGLLGAVRPAVPRAMPGVTTTSWPRWWLEKEDFTALPWTLRLNARVQLSSPAELSLGGSHEMEQPRSWTHPDLHRFGLWGAKPAQRQPG